MKEEYLKTLGLDDEFGLLEKAEVQGVYGLMVGMKKLKTRPTRTLEIEIDPSYGPTVIEMAGGDIPAENTNEIMVAVINWDDFVSLCKKALGTQ